jgi:hypothetical protein
VQHPPTTQLSDLHQQPATRAVYDNAPAIESSRRLLLRTLIRLRSRSGSAHIASVSSASAPSRIR